MSVHLCGYKLHNGFEILLSSMLTNDILNMAPDRRAVLSQRHIWVIIENGLFLKLASFARKVNPYMNSAASFWHYSNVIMIEMQSQITSLTIVYWTVYLGADQRKHQSSASLAFAWGIHRWPVNSPHKWPVTPKMFPFDDVIMGIVPCIVQHSMHSIVMHPVDDMFSWPTVMMVLHDSYGLFRWFSSGRDGTHIYQCY